MKVLPFHIPKNDQESFRVQIDREQFFYDRLHAHSEIQVSMVVSSTGTVVCGDYVGQFSPGDVFIIGGGQPHVFKNAESYYRGEEAKAELISFFYTPDSFGDTFFSLPDLEDLKVMMGAASRGMRFSNIDLSLFQTLAKAKGIDRFVAMLQVMSMLNDKMKSGAVVYLAPSMSSFRMLGEVDGERMKAVMDFTIREFQREISLEEVADVANMTVNSFCRFFKLRTRTTYVTFLNNIRVNNASRLLATTEESVAFCAMESGFGNLSHFNTVFKQVMKLTPSKYRRNYKST